MSIRRKLVLSATVELVLILLMGAVLWLASWRTDRSMRNEEHTTNIVRVVTEIRFATFENLLHHDERSFEQWQIKHAELATLLLPSSFPSDENRQYADAIAKDSQDIGALFTQLNQSYSTAAQGVQASVTKNVAEERLGAQIVLKQQAQIENALRLSSAGRNEISRLRSRTDVSVFTLAVFIIAIALLNLLVVIRSITKGLAALQTGAANIARGKFGYRIKARHQNDEFGQLAGALNRMNASLEQLDKTKAEFIVLASHQLRTPLTALKWYSEDLLHNSKISAAERKKSIKQIYESNERMIAFVDQLLHASEADLGQLKLQPETVNVNELLTQVIEDLSSDAQATNTTIKTKVDPKFSLVVDRGGLEGIFYTLISNAVRYSPKGTTVAISAEVKDRHALLCVRDHGYGIATDQQDKLFTKFYRGTKAREVIGEGSGLGLYVTKAMVKQLGGEIWFESAEDAGSTFYVKLPLRDVDTSGKST